MSPHFLATIDSPVFPEILCRLETSAALIEIEVSLDKGIVMKDLALGGHLIQRII